MTERSVLFGFFPAMMSPPTTAVRDLASKYGLVVTFVAEDREALAQPSANIGMLVVEISGLEGSVDAAAAWLSRRIHQFEKRLCRKLLIVLVLQRNRELIDVVAAAKLRAHVLGESIQCGGSLAVNVATTSPATIRTRVEAEVWELVRALADQDSTYLTGVDFRFPHSPASTRNDQTEMPGRSILVSGGSRGLGAEICRELVDAGWAAISLSRTQPLDQRVHWAPCDVTIPTQMTRAISQARSDFGPIVAGIANAGIGGRGLIIRDTRDRWEEMLRLNLLGAVDLARGVIRELVPQRRGSVIFVSSTSAISGEAGLSAYTASKSALHGLTLSLAKEYANRSIAINAVVPGLLENAAPLVRGEARRRWVDSTPIGVGSPTDVARFVRYLIESSPFTGRLIPIDGGFSNRALLLD